MTKERGREATKVPRERATKERATKVPKRERERERRWLDSDFCDRANLL